VHLPHGGRGRSGAPDPAHRAHHRRLRPGLRRRDDGPLPALRLDDADRYLMPLRDRGARTGAAGFVLSRLLLEPPSQALAENFATPQMRESWPLQDPDSTAALAGLETDRYDALLREHTALFRGRPPLVSLHESAWRTDV